MRSLKKRRGVTLSTRSLFLKLFRLRVSSIQITRTLFDHKPTNPTVSAVRSDEGAARREVNSDSRFCLFVCLFVCYRHPVIPEARYGRVSSLCCGQVELRNGRPPQIRAAGSQRDTVSLSVCSKTAHTHARTGARLPELLARGQVRQR